MQPRFKGPAGMAGRGKNQARGSRNIKNRTSKRTGIAPANRTRASNRAKDNQGRNQKEWAAEKRMAARY